MDSRQWRDVGIQSVDGRSPLLLLAVALALLVLAVAAPPVYAAERDEQLQSSGIRFPEGFDVNTIGAVKGRVSALARPDVGPVRFRLETDLDVYAVLVAPYSFWRELGVQVENGDIVVVRGSKTVGRDGRLYIVAQTIKQNGGRYAYKFRTNDGDPLWTMATDGREGERQRKRDYKGLKEWPEDTINPGGPGLRRGLFR
jgi:hypothetical protein